MKVPKYGAFIVVSGSTKDSFMFLTLIIVDLREKAQGPTKMAWKADVQGKVDGDPWCLRPHQRGPQRGHHPDYLSAKPPVNFRAEIEAK